MERGEVSLPQLKCVLSPASDCVLIIGLEAASLYKEVGTELESQAECLLIMRWGLGDEVFKQEVREIERGAGAMPGAKVLEEPTAFNFCTAINALILPGITLLSKYFSSGLVSKKDLKTSISNSKEPSCLTALLASSTSLHTSESLEHDRSFAMLVVWQLMI